MIWRTFFNLFYGMITIINAQQLRSLGSFSCPNAAFLHLTKLSPLLDEKNEKRNTLFVSSFDSNPFAADFVYKIDNIDQKLNQFSKVSFFFLIFFLFFDI